MPDAFLGRGKSICHTGKREVERRADAERKNNHVVYKKGYSLAPSGRQVEYSCLERIQKKNGEEDTSTKGKKIALTTESVKLAKRVKPLRAPPYRGKLYEDARKKTKDNLSEQGKKDAPTRLARPPSLLLLLKNGKAYSFSKQEGVNLQEGKATSEEQGKKERQPSLLVIGEDALVRNREKKKKRSLYLQQEKSEPTDQGHRKKGTVSTAPNGLSQIKEGGYLVLGKHQRLKEEKRGGTRMEEKRKMRILPP